MDEWMDNKVEKFWVTILTKLPICPKIDSLRNFTIMVFLYLIMCPTMIQILKVNHNGLAAYPEMYAWKKNFEKSF